MSELKAYSGEDIQDLIDNGDKIDLEYLNKQFVEKSEADKVITELKKACNDKDDWCLHTLKELRYNKYKRCLAMVMWCEASNVSLYSIVENNLWKYTSNYWLRWRNKWLKLAEKFKESK